MRVKALVSFSGIITMSAGEVGEISEKEVLNDLLRAGYVEEVKAEKKAVKPDENKRCKR